MKALQRSSQIHKGLIFSKFWSSQSAALSLPNKISIFGKKLRLCREETAFFYLLKMLTFQTVLLPVGDNLRICFIYFFFILKLTVCSISSPQNLKFFFPTEGMVSLQVSQMVFQFTNVDDIMDVNVSLTSFASCKRPQHFTETFSMK